MTTSPTTPVPPASAPLSCVIAGGSGVVGTRLVARLLADPAVARVTAIGRRPLALQHEKLSTKRRGYGEAEQHKDQW